MVRAWANAARALGLDLRERTAAFSGAHEDADFSEERRAVGAEAPLGSVMVGARGGAEVMVTRGEIGRETDCIAAIAPTLRLGLLARTGAPDVVFPATFADFFTIAPSFDARARELVEFVGAELALEAPAGALPTLDAELWLTDTFAMVRRRALVTSVRALTAQLDAAVAFATAAMSARKKLSPATWEAELLGAWSPVADERGLHVDLERLAITGRYVGLDVWLYLYSTRREMVTVLRVGLPRAVRVGLRIFEASLAWRLRDLFGGVKRIACDPAFDARFVVEGRPEAMVRELLSTEFRSRVLGLHARAHTLRSLSVHDGLLEVVLDGALYDGAAVAAFLDDSVEAAQVLSAPGRSWSRAAYR